MGQYQTADELHGCLWFFISSSSGAKDSLKDVARLFHRPRTTFERLSPPSVTTQSQRPDRPECFSNAAKITLIVTKTGLYLLKDDKHFHLCREHFSQLESAVNQKRSRTQKRPSNRKMHQSSANHLQNDSCSASFLPPLTAVCIQNVAVWKNMEKDRRCIFKEGELYPTKYPVSAVLADLYPVDQL